MRTRWPGILRLWLVVVSMLLLPVEVWSQDQTKSITPIAVGTRIRLRARTVARGRIEGIVIEMDENSLLIGLKDRFPIICKRRPLRVPRQAISQLDVSMGKRRQPLEGMIAGAGYVLIMLPVIAWSLGNCIHWDDAPIMGEYMLYGAEVGFVIGALTKRDRWIAVPLEKVHFSLAPIQRGGVRLSLSVRF
jgi:hypothetical protein